MSQTSWDSDFDNIIENSKFEITLITTDGNIMYSNSSFLNVANLAVVRANTITSYNTTYLNASWNIFSIPSLNAYASLISTLSNPMN
jgi:hypothetical protein